ncbi:MAG: hypothetical protein IJ736_15885 [Firmicutes bacterium]|nr:hypothetical protein [Bacillota bacterium]
MSEGKYDISVEKLEEIIYNAPWLIDEKLAVANIKGETGENGRHICLSFNKSRFIKLLFKDTRSNRPVIVDIINGDVGKENVADIMLYRAILVSTTDENRKALESEFGNNYHCPRLIIIGKSASADMYISANLAGIEILTYADDKETAINFDKLEVIDERIKNWKEFKDSGEVTLEERDKWAEDIYYKIDDIVYNMQIPDLSMSKLYRTNAKFFWTEGMVYPFVNIGFTYNNEYLAGIYEYFTEEMPYSGKSIYFDFVVPSLYYDYGNDEESTEKIKDIVEGIMTDNGFPIIKFDHGQITIKIKRNILANDDELRDTITELINLAIDIVNRSNNTY